MSANEADRWPSSSAAATAAWPAAPVMLSSDRSLRLGDAGNGGKSAAAAPCMGAGGGEPGTGLRVKVHLEAEAAAHWREITGWWARVAVAGAQCWRARAMHLA